jgi:hypothetical protein
VARLIEHRESLRTLALDFLLVIAPRFEAKASLGFFAGDRASL